VDPPSSAAANATDPPQEGESVSSPPPSPEQVLPPPASQDEFVSVVKVRTQEVLRIKRTDLQLIADTLHRELAHAGVKSTYLAINKEYEGKAANTAIAETVRNCTTCAAIKPPPIVHLSQGKLETKRKNQIVACDLVEYNTSVNGNWLALTVIDEYTHQMCAIPLSNKEASTTVEAFKQWVRAHGFPQNLRRDPGSEFKAEFLDWLTLNGVNVSGTPTGRGQSNAIVERMHRDLHVAIRAELADRMLDIDRWDEVIEAAASKLNRRPSTVPSKQGMSPFELGCGIPPPLHSLAFMKRVAEADEFIDPAQNYKYKAGDRVLYRHPNLKRAKLEDVCKPYVVIKCSG
jgi:hypothetical protein